jgi:hypothetical protein
MIYSLKKSQAFEFTQDPICGLNINPRCTVEMREGPDFCLESAGN